MKCHYATGIFLTLYGPYRLLIRQQTVLRRCTFLARTIFFFHKIMESYRWILSRWCRPKKMKPVLCEPITRCFREQNTPFLIKFSYTAVIYSSLLPCSEVTHSCNTRSRQVGLDHVCSIWPHHIKWRFNFTSCFPVPILCLNEGEF